MTVIGLKILETRRRGATGLFFEDRPVDFPSLC